MKLKLLKDYTQADGTIAPKDSAFDSVETGLDEATVQQLIAEGIAEEIKEEEIEAMEKAVEEDTNGKICQKSLDILKLKTKAVKESAKDVKMEHLICKGVKEALKTKAITTYSGTEATEVMGIIGQDAKVYGLVNKRPVKGNLNIVYSKANSSADAPVIGIVGEDTAAATTVTYGQYAAIPAKWFATVSIPNEYLDGDVPGFEDFITRELGNKLNIVLDNSVLNGTFTNNYGFKGICGDANAAEAAVFTSLTAPTKAELQSMMKLINPAVADKAVWIVKPSFWAGCVAELMDANNVNSQLITDGAKKTMFGYPVIVTVAASATHPVVFVDLTNYVAGIAREIEIELDKSASFAKDATIAKISIRAAGGLAAGKQTFDGVDYASAVYGSVKAG